MKTIILLLCCMLSFQMFGQQPILISGQKLQGEFQGRSLYVKFESKEHRLGQPTEMLVGKQEKHMVFLYKFDDNTQTENSQPKHCIYFIRNNELKRVFIDVNKLKNTIT